MFGRSWLTHLQLEGTSKRCPWAQLRVEACAAHDAAGRSSLALHPLHLGAPSREQLQGSATINRVQLVVTRLHKKMHAACHVVVRPATHMTSFQNIWRSARTRSCNASRGGGSERGWVCGGVGDRQGIPRKRRPLKPDGSARLSRPPCLPPQELPRGWQ
jgi:hypothetical protein